MNHWTVPEVSALRANYPVGGIDAVAPLLPNRTRYAIYQKAQLLKLRSTVMPAVRESYPQDDEIDARIRRVHEGPMARGALLELAQRINRPAWWVSRRARQLGLKTPRFREPPWSATELELLRTTAHIGTCNARKHFLAAGFNRSETSIQVKRKRERISVVAARQDAGTYHAHEVAELLGVDGKTVIRWINFGELKARKCGDFWFVQERDIRKFVISHPLRVELRKIPDSNRVWFIELLAGTVGVSVEAAA